jgi:hypothetical protein
VPADHRAPCVQISRHRNQQGAVAMASLPITASTPRASWSCVISSFLLAPLAVALLAATPARAEVKPWPASFHAEQMAVSDGTQYVRVGGTGPAVVLLHGFGDTGDMWMRWRRITP